METFQTFKQTLLDQVNIVYSFILKIINDNMFRHVIVASCRIIIKSMLIVGTPYEGGVFKCKLVVDAEFP